MSSYYMTVMYYGHMNFSENVATACTYADVQLSSCQRRKPQCFLSSSASTAPETGNAKNHRLLGARSKRRGVFIYAYALSYAYMRVCVHICRVSPLKSGVNGGSRGYTHSSSRFRSVRKSVLFVALRL